MIKKIFKYKIPEITDSFVIEMPKGAEILTIQMQKDIPQIWALVNPNTLKEARLFRLIGTGHSIHYDEDTDFKYIGSFQMLKGDLVLHLFEEL